MVTSPCEWKILEWDDKPQTKKQTNIPKIIDSLKYQISSCFELSVDARQNIRFYTVPNIAKVNEKQIFTKKTNQKCSLVLTFKFFWLFFQFKSLAYANTTFRRVSGSIWSQPLNSVSFNRFVSTVHMDLGCHLDYNTWNQGPISPRFDNLFPRLLGTRPKQTLGIIVCR